MQCSAVPPLTCRRYLHVRAGGHGELHVLRGPGHQNVSKSEEGYRRKGGEESENDNEGVERGRVICKYTKKMPNLKVTVIESQY